MPDKLEVFIVGDYKKGIADGLAEFNYQTADLLKDTFTFHFVEFDRVKNENLSHFSTVDTLHIHRFGSKKISPFKLPNSFCRWIGELPVGGVLFHLSHIYNLNNYLISRLLFKYNIPYIITPHDSFVYCRSYSKSKPFLKRAYRKIFIRFIDKYIFDHAAAIHDLTERYSSCIRELTKSPIIVVPNQVKDIGLPLDMSIIQEEVCFIGRSNILSKGIDLSIKSFGLFKSHAPRAHNISFTMIGPATDEQNSLRRQLSLEAGLREGTDIIFTGAVSELERNEILYRSKVYLQLSRSEGFGLSVVQALCCYKPVIISNQIPISNKIRQHNAGFVVATIEEAAEALSQVFELSDTQYEELACNARQCYNEEFHPSVVKPKLVTMFNNACH